MKLVHSGATPQALAIWRVYVLGILLVWLSIYDWSMLAWVPRGQFRTVGIFKLPFLMTFLLNGTVLHWFQIGAVIAAVLGILNIFTRWAVLACALLSFVYCRLCISMFFSHFSLGMLFAVFILAGALFLEHRDRRRKIEGVNYAPATLQLTALVVLTTYSMIGVHRIAFAGLETLRADYLLGWFIQRSSGEYQYSLHLQDHPWLLRFLEIGFPLSTVVEALAPFALVSRLVKWIFFLTVVPFHFIILVFMNIFFWQNVLLLPLLLFDFSVLFNPRVARGGGCPAGC
jgi:hypothetical protein